MTVSNVEVNEVTKSKKILRVDIKESTVNIALLSKNKNEIAKVIETIEKPMAGIEAGNILNMEEAYDSLLKVMNQLRRTVGEEELNDVKLFLSLPKTLGTSFESKGIVNHLTKEISRNEIAESIKSALYNSEIEKESKIVNYTATNFKVDGVKTKNPIHMNGKRLETTMVIETMSEIQFNNYKHLMTKCGYEISYIEIRQNYYEELLKTEGYPNIVDLTSEKNRMVVVSRNFTEISKFKKSGTDKIIDEISLKYTLKISEAKNILDNYKVIKESLNDHDNFEIERNGGETMLISFDGLKEVIETGYSRIFDEVNEKVTNQNKILFISEDLEDTIAKNLKDKMENAYSFTTMNKIYEQSKVITEKTTDIEVFHKIMKLDQESKYIFNYKEDNVTPTLEVVEEGKILNISTINEEKEETKSSSGYLGKIKKTIIDMW